MAVLNCLVSKTFMNLELFLQKAAGLDIFEGLIFKYKVKIDLLEPLSIHFLAFLKEFANQLQYVVEETTLQKQEQFEHLSNTASILGITNSDESVPIKTEVSSTHAVDQEVRNISGRGSKPMKDDSTSGKPKPKQASNTKKGHVKRKCKVQKKKWKLSKRQLEKGKEDLFKTLSSLKVESVFEEAKDSYASRHEMPSIEDNQFQKYLPGLEPEIQHLFKCEEDTVPQSIPDNLPFYCCLTCLEVYKSPETYDRHCCKEGATTGDGTETSKKDDAVSSVTTSQLVRQVERLRAMKSFKCGLCREEYRSFDRITYHLPRCGGGPYRCELCPLEYQFKRDLNTHKKKSHRREKCFFCDECDVVFLHRTSLQKHQVNRHEQNQTLFSCEFCHQQFTKRINLTNHNISEHKLEKKFLCQVCGKKFFTQGSLQVHLEIHSEPRKFSCAYCAKKFQQKEKLLFHTRIHTGERPHLCQTCGKRFIRKSKLDEHMRRHRGEKRFQCRLCNKCYAGNWDLKIHVKKQHSISSTDPPTDSPQSLATTKTDVTHPNGSVSKRAKRKPSRPTGKTSQTHDESNKDVQVPKPLEKIKKQETKSEASCNDTEHHPTGVLFPVNQTMVVDNENGVSQRIVLMDSPLLLPNQTLSLNNDENSSRIIVLNPLQSQNKSDDGSRILVQVSNPQSEHNNQDRRVFLQLDQQHQNSIYTVSNGMQVNALGDNLNAATQYIQLTEQDEGDVTGSNNIMPIVQFPMSAMAQNNLSSAFQTQAGIVFTSSFDINNLTYIDKVVEDFR